MQKYKFVINPVPLKKKHRIFLEQLRGRMQESNTDFSYEYTSKMRGATQISKEAARRGYDIVVACGGDGTLMEVANGIYGTRSKLGILPFGTSNDFAKHVGITLDNVAEVLFEGKPREMNLGLVTFRNRDKEKKLLFCSTSGLGFDSDLLRLNRYKIFISLKKSLGSWIYILCAFFMIFSYKSNEVDIIFRNKKLRLKLFMLNANFIKSMSGIKVTPNADINNGSFDIIIFEEAGMIKKIIGFVWYSITSKKLDFREINYISTKSGAGNRHGLHDVNSFSVKSKIPIGLQLNGDFVGCTPIKFNIAKKKIELLAK